MPFRITQIIDEERLPFYGGVLILLHSWEEVDPASLARLAGRKIHVWLQPPPVADITAVLLKREVALIRADAQAQASPGMGKLNPLIAELLAVAAPFVVLPAIAEPVAKTLYLGFPLARTEATAEKIRLALYDASEEAFLSRPDLGDHLGFACLKGLKRKWFKPVFIDGFLDSRVLKGGMLLAAAGNSPSGCGRTCPKSGSASS